MLSLHSKIYKQFMIDLFQPEDRRLNEMIKRVNTQNKAMLFSSVDGFMYKGKMHIPEGVTVIRVLNNIPSLALALHGEMEQYYRDREKIINDKLAIKQALAPVFMHSNNLQELRDGLPNCAVDLIPEIKGMQRHMLTANFLFGSNKFMLRSYEKAVPMIEMYAVMRLLY